MSDLPGKLRRPLRPADANKLRHGRVLHAIQQAWNLQPELPMGVLIGQALSVADLIKTGDQELVDALNKLADTEAHL